MACGTNATKAHSKLKYFRLKVASVTTRAVE
jgi:hypothetical protein